MNKKKWLALLLGLMMVWLIVACSHKEEPAVPDIIDVEAHGDLETVAAAKPAGADGTAVKPVASDSQPDDQEQSIEDAAASNGSEPAADSTITPTNVAELMALTAAAYAPPVTANLNFSGSIQIGPVSNKFTVTGIATLDASQVASATMNADFDLLQTSTPTAVVFPFIELVSGMAPDNAIFSQEDDFYAILVNGSCPASLKAFYDSASQDATTQIIFDVNASYKAYFDKNTYHLMKITDISSTGTGRVMEQDRETSISGSVTFSY